MSSNGTDGCSDTPTAAATARDTSSGRVSGPSSTTYTPVKLRWIRLASSSASRVLPTPAGPNTVMRRLVRSSRAIAISSPCRPTNRSTDSGGPAAGFLGRSAGDARFVACWRRRRYARWRQALEQKTAAFRGPGASASGSGAPQQAQL